jgi:hypothetical protein
MIKLQQKWNLSRANTTTTTTTTTTNNSIVIYLCENL